MRNWQTPGTGRTGDSQQKERSENHFLANQMARWLRLDALKFYRIIFYNLLIFLMFSKRKDTFYKLPLTLLVIKQRPGSALIFRRSSNYQQDYKRILDKLAALLESSILSAAAGIPDFLHVLEARS